jgi:diguanylate cyclase (GGDEF)-like protein/PAS domain S-box-containing protein
MRIFRDLALLLGLLTLGLGGLAAPLRIGLLAFEPKELVFAAQADLARRLHQALPDQQFEVLATTYPELETQVRRGGVDFILTNPGHYLDLAANVALTAPLATVVMESRSHGPLIQFGGVIVVRSDRSDLQTLADLSGRRIAAVSPRSFGAFQAQAFELLRAGIDVRRDCELMYLGMPHDGVVEAVMSGQADAGFVRSGVIERMIQTGLLDPALIRVVHPVRVAGFPLRLSTPLYPEWPVVASAALDRDLVRRVTIALLGLERNDQVPGSMQFTTPSGYQSTEVVLRSLRLPPFDHLPEFTMADVWSRYAWQVTMIGGLAGIIALLSLRQTRLNARLEREHRKLRDEIHQRHSLLRVMNQGVIELDAQGRCTLINPAALRLLDRAETELLGQEVLSRIHQHPADSAIRLAFQNGQSRSCEDWLVRRNGDVFPVALHLSVHHGPGGLSTLSVIFQDISERKLEEQRVRHLAYHDALTGLPNRILAADRLDQAMHLSRRIGLDRVALLYIDLDGFKPVNDSFGHAAGDLLLIHVGRRLQSSVRISDTAARIGGDEFLVILHGVATLDDAWAVADKILVELRQPVVFDGREVRISASIGLALDLGEIASAEGLRSLADQAMYEAKARGGDQIRVAEHPHLDVVGHGPEWMI